MSRHPQSLLMAIQEVSEFEHHYLGNFDQISPPPGLNRGQGLQHICNISLPYQTWTLLLILDVELDIINFIFLDSFCNNNYNIFFYGSYHKNNDHFPLAFLQ